MHNHLLPSHLLNTLVLPLNILNIPLIATQGTFHSSLSDLCPLFLVGVSLNHKQMIRSVHYSLETREQSP